MPPRADTVQPGRRERNKQVKRERIIAAAAALFSTRGVDEVTTQEIAEQADIGAGTLFLYVRSKGELLLLVQNSRYEEALARGRIAAESTHDAVQGVLAIVGEIVACNRVQVDNGRTYLREMVFGDADEEYRSEALNIVRRTELAVEEILIRDRRDPARAAVLARTVSAVMLHAMTTAAPDATVAAVTTDIEEQLNVLIGP